MLLMGIEFTRHRAQILVANLSWESIQSRTLAKGLDSIQVMISLNLHLTDLLLTFF